MTTKAYTLKACGSIFGIHEKVKDETSYRIQKQRVYVGQSNNKLANEWLGASGSVVKIETMNYKDLQKRSSKTERQDKKSVVTDRTGRKRSIRKIQTQKTFWRKYIEACTVRLSVYDQEGHSHLWGCG